MVKYQKHFVKSKNEKRMSMFKTSLSNMKYKDLKLYAFFNVPDTDCPHDIVSYVVKHYIMTSHYISSLKCIFLIIYLFS